MSLGCRFAQEKKNTWLAASAASSAALQCLLLTMNFKSPVCKINFLSNLYNGIVLAWKDRCLPGKNQSFPWNEESFPLNYYNIEIQGLSGKDNGIGVTVLY